RNDRVDEDHEVRRRAYPGYLVLAVRVAAIDVSPCRCGEVSACRKAHDADAVRIDTPLFCVPPCHSNGTLGVSQGNRMPVLRSVPVPQNNGSHAERIEPPRNLNTLVIEGERSVASTGTNHYRRPVRRL